MNNKKILILGGTHFIGRNLVEYLLKEGEYDITLFNRQTRNDLFPNVAKIKGDRETLDIKQIENIQWDYIVDLSCFYPDSLINTIKQLNVKYCKYIFISSCSVYSNENYNEILRDENAPILSCNSKEKIDRTDASYGKRKAECERIIQESIDNYVILRPSLVFGTYDYTDRMYYWLYQVKRGSTLLLPENGERKFSITYIDDLIKVITKSISPNKSNSVYNVISFPQVSIRKIILAAQNILKTQNKIVSASAEFLLNNRVNQWTDIPLWLNTDIFTYSNQKLKRDFKIELSDFQQSLGNTIDYYEFLDWQNPNCGINEERKIELIERLKNSD